MTYYVYITLNMINYKCYIGVTSKSIDSGYVGSGKIITRALKKYGKCFFIRHDLFEGNIEEASEMEKRYIEYYDATNSKDFYNLRHGGYDGSHGIETRKIISTKTKEAWLNSDKRKKYIAAFYKRDNTNIGKYDKIGIHNPMYGKHHTDVAKTKMSMAKRGKPLNLSSIGRNKLVSNIKMNGVMMGSKSNKQKSKNRWSALSKTFSKTPIISDDIRMMHDFYGIHEAMAKLPKEHLEEYLKFRFRFLQEELNEGVAAIDAKDPEEVCDALIDLIVVAIGTLDLYQVDFKKAWYEVLKANMNKEVGVKASRPNPWKLPDLIKNPDWIPPSHSDNHGLLTQALK